MIVLLCSSGQLGNQLLSLSSTIAMGLEYKRKVICPIVDKRLFEYFELDFEENDKIKIIKLNLSLYKFFSKFMNKLNKLIFLRRSNNEYIKKIKKEKISFIPFFAIKDDIAFMNNLDNIRKYFKFKEHIYDKCEEEISEIRNEDKKIVAVHIRRGDYQNFNNGKWYYSDEYYLRWIRELYNERQDLIFIIFSNEKVDKEFYAKSNIPIYFSRGSAIEDLCKMSLCDFIMGPPSTYSWWASVIGNVRRYPISDRDDSCKFDKFLTIEERIVTNTNLY